MKKLCNVNLNLKINKELECCNWYILWYVSIRLDNFYKKKKIFYAQYLISRMKLSLSSPRLSSTKAPLVNNINIE